MGHWENDRPIKAFAFEARAIGWDEARINMESMSSSVIIKYIFVFLLFVLYGAIVNMKMFFSCPTSESEA